MKRPRGGERLLRAATRARPPLRRAQDNQQAKQWLAPKGVRFLHGNHRPLLIVMHVLRHAIYLLDERPPSARTSNLAVAFFACPSC